MTTPEAAGAQAAIHRLHGEHVEHLHKRRRQAKQAAEIVEKPPVGRHVRERLAPALPNGPRRRRATLHGPKSVRQPQQRKEREAIGGQRVADKNPHGRPRARKPPKAVFESRPAVAGGKPSSGTPWSRLDRAMARRPPVSTRHIGAHGRSDAGRSRRRPAKSPGKTRE